MNAVNYFAQRVTSKSAIRIGPVLVCLLLAPLLGCTTISYPLGPTAPPPSYQFLTGNWEFSTAPTSGSKQFGRFGGFINEESVSPGVNDPVTASLQVEEPATCFLGTVVVPLQGTLQKTDLSLISFADVSQFLSIAAVQDATANHLTGTYSIGGGCASGSQGTLSGTKYAPLTGTYSDSAPNSTSNNGLLLVLAQRLQGNGDGTSDVSGSAKFAGISCFNAATIISGPSVVLGSKVNLLLNTNEVGSTSQVTVIGTFDPTADLITTTSITISGGACAGTLAVPPLTLQ